MEPGAASGLVVVLALVFAFAVLLLRSIRMTQEWKRAVVLRLGRFHAVKGPGLYLLWPIDTVATVIDMRIQTINITAEQALTRDTVAVGVDAIVFWQVEDARAAAVNIVNVFEAIERVSQTSLREMIGATELGRLLSDRHTADTALRETIAAKTRDWGVAVRAVEIRDVAIPAALQDAMSRQAQAERERDARVTLASAETAIAAQVLAAAETYGKNPVALQLRQMNLLYEMNKERGATVLIPTDMAAALGRIFTTPA
jgi:regulator of protease activity HflC (stomatin/prohibitin superfamily)